MYSVRKLKHKCCAGNCDAENNRVKSGRSQTFTPWIFYSNDTNGCGKFNAVVIPVVAETGVFTLFECLLFKSKLIFHTLFLSWVYFNVNKEKLSLSMQSYDAIIWIFHTIKLIYFHCINNFKYFFLHLHLPVTLKISVTLHTINFPLRKIKIMPTFRFVLLVSLILCRTGHALILLVLKLPWKCSAVFNYIKDVGCSKRFTRLKFLNR